MAKQVIGIGSTAGDNTGDTLRVGGDKINDNFTELYGAIGNGVTQDELRAIVHVIGIYCGVPQAVDCFRVAKKVLEEK